MNLSGANVSRDCVVLSQFVLGVYRFWWDLQSIVMWYN